MVSYEYDHASRAKVFEGLSMKGFIKPPAAQKKSPRLVLIDDDPTFLSIMKRSAEIEGISLDCYQSLEDLGFIGLIKNYDAAILDYDLGSLNAIEIAHYIENFLQELPTIIISAKDRSEECQDLPDCVKSVLKKSVGYQHILQVALRCLKLRTTDYSA